MTVLSYLKSNRAQQALKLIALALSAVPLMLVLLYHNAYAVNAPIWWMDFANLRLAVTIRNGSAFPIHEILRPFVDHNLVASRLLATLNVHLTDWNLRVESLANISVATATAAMAFALFRRYEPRLAFVALIPFAALILSLRHDFNWLVGLHLGSFIPGFTLLLMLLIMHQVTYPRLLIAALLTTFASFSYLASLPLWPLILLVMWGIGHRRWPHYALWIGLMLLCLLLMVSTGSNVENKFVAEQGFRLTNFRLSWSDVPSMLRFMTAFLGSPLTYNTPVYFRGDELAVYTGDIDLASLIGTLGLILWAANIWFLHRSGYPHAKLVAWLVLGLYAGAVAAMVCLGRLQSLTVPDVGLDYALQFWYVNHPTLFWVSLTALMLLSAVHVTLPRHPQSVAGYARIAVNAIAAVAMLVLYIRANALTLSTTAADWGHGLGTNRSAEVEACLFNYIFTRDHDCAPPALNLFSFQPQHILAAHRLGLYAHQPTTSILSAPITPETRVITETQGSDIWLAIHLRDWLLDGLDPDHQFVVAPHYATPLPDDIDIPHPPHEIATQPDPHTVDRLATFLGDTPEFWYIEEITSTRTSLTHRLLQQVETDQIYEVTQDMQTQHTIDFAVTRFAPTTRAVTHEFGGEMSARLHGWSLRDPAQVQPCQPITLESWWSIESPSPNHTMTLVIADAAGVGIAAQDAPPFGLAFEDWHSGWIYRDIRTLTMPCDAASGDYLLLTSLYQLYPYVAGDYLYLTTLVVP